MCVSIAATTTGVVALNYTRQSCLSSTYCVNGSASLGFSKGSVASKCCNISLCNKDIPAVSIETKHNGTKCCTTRDCSEIVSCVGDEDLCFNATVSFGIFKIETRGCTTKSVCDELRPIGLLNNVNANVTCCKKDFCNGVEKLTLGFFLMTVPLLSFILFH
ncbi:urokinase plasminogen activator surface receptor-like [Trichomycterus rosablanca]|uniref:urokinase plasminogen activator surface receptor-like n=1 Tax=Trichomycterus rosablanca TaxID=2290929 RepID=UPI002F353205